MTKYRQNRITSYEDVVYEFIESYGGGLHGIIELPVDCLIYQHWGFIMQLYYHYNKLPHIVENGNQVEMTFNNMKDSFTEIFIWIAKELGHTSLEAKELLKDEI